MYVLYLYKYDHLLNSLIYIRKLYHRLMSSDSQRQQHTRRLRKSRQLKKKKY